MTNTDTTTPDTDTILDTYFAMWQTTDPDERAALVAQAFAPNGRHVDQHAVISFTRIDRFEQIEVALELDAPVAVLRYEIDVGDRPIAHPRQSRQMGRT